MFRRIIIALLLCLAFNSAEATHNRGGEITFKRTGPLSYEIRITTYTQTNATADRPKLYVQYGDGTGDSINRVSQTFLANVITKNEYVSTHRFPAQGRYTVSVTDPNRNMGVQNIPNSVNTPFHIESMLIINPFLDPQSSVVLLNPPIDFGCTNRLFVHNPNAYDADGDSISFKMIDCLGENGNPIPGYRLPAGNITLDAKTGQFIWDSPQNIGEYNFAFLIEEWRSGVKIGSIIRDIQVDIKGCNNNPPQLILPPDTCVKAGDTISFIFEAIDIDDDSITITATGGAFLFAPPNQAVLQTLSEVAGKTRARFTWIPPCEAVREEPYQILFKATDPPRGGRFPEPSLVDLQPWNVKVVSPPPTLTNIASKAGEITIDWDNSTTCPEARGYYIYRKQGGPAGLVPDPCETGVPSGSGYQLIDNVLGFNTTTYIDNDKGAGLASGVEYCYVVTAFFSLSPNNIFNGSESCASNELCAVVKRDLPVITKADIQVCDPTIGEVRIEWSAPTELDSIQFPGPYKIELFRNSGFERDAGSATLIDTYLFNNLFEIIDSFKVDDNLNTQDAPNAYWMNFYFNSTELVGVARASSTVFLDINPMPSQLELFWKYNTNWTNDSFFIYKEIMGSYVIIDTVINSDSYIDTDLVDGQDYCYYVLSSGGFNMATALPTYILNRSNKSCDFPRDTIPPCPPILIVDDNCEAFINTLNWTIEDSSCINDLRSYRIYHQAFSTDPYKLVDSVNRDIGQFIHQLTRYSSAGCYAITAVDSSFNESIFSNVVCVENCPQYRLPNVFTPGSDNTNDQFGPFPYRNVDRVDMRIFNRWGQLIFRTENPDINWDGKSAVTGLECSAATYYYICKVYDVRFDGIQERTLKGVVKLIRKE